MRGPTVLVVGATGPVGRASVDALRARDARVVALTRRPDRAGLPTGVEVRRGDLGDPVSVVAALAGVDRVVVVSAGSRKAEFDATVARAAVAAGVTRLVSVSSLAVDEDPGATLGRWHAEAELALIRSGLPCTVLRPNGFFTNTLAWAPAVRVGGPIEVALPDLAAAHVDPLDIADVAATVAVDPAPRPDRETLRLTGPAAITPREQVATIARVTGQTLRLREIALAEELARLSRRVPAEVAAAVLAARATAGPVRNQVFGDGPAVTGRPARTFDDFVRRELGAFTGR